MIRSAWILLLTSIFGFADSTDAKLFLWSNKIGPYRNPQEAYPYFSLPYCRFYNDDSNNNNVTQSFAESLGGFALERVVALSPGARHDCTTKPLTQSQAEHFNQAVNNRWFYQMYVDGLPVWGMVGEMLVGPNEEILQPRQQEDANSLQPYIYTDRNLLVSTNPLTNQIVKVDLMSDPKSLSRVQAGKQYTFRLDIKFQPVELEHEDRFDRYMDHSYFHSSTRWGFAIYGTILAAVLVGRVASILRQTKKTDMEDGGEAASSLSDIGWKSFALEDVFSTPSSLSCMAAVIGTGWQLTVLAFGVLLWLFVSGRRSFETRGEILLVCIIGYFVTTIVAGYVSGYLSKQYDTSPANEQVAGCHYSWRWTMLRTLCWFPAMLATTVLMISAISYQYGTIYTLSSHVIGHLLLLWICVAVPFGVIGTLLGRYHAQQTTPTSIGSGADSDASLPLLSSRNDITTSLTGGPKQVRHRKLFLELWMGFLLFSCIYSELDCIMGSLWHYKLYKVCAFDLVSLFLLVILSATISSIVAFTQLNSHTRNWQWVVVRGGSATGLAVLAYSIQYFYYNTQMSGLFQTSFYFGYMFLISMAVALMCAATAHSGASWFVRTIYGNHKVN